MLFIFLFYLSMLLPAFSLSQVFIGKYFQNRILWLPLGLFYFSKRLKYKITQLSVPFVVLSTLFLAYIIFSVLVGWNFLIYTGYFLTSLLLVVTIPIIMKYPMLYIRFFKIFFICNLVFVVWQILCVNIGWASLSMIQSNLPAQKEAGYFIPFFIRPPFIRYSGLFNESSPFNIYLIICFCFFKSLGSKYRPYKKLSFIAILFGGAKIGYLFLISYSVFFVKSKIIRIIAVILLITVVYIIIMNFDLLMQFTHGEARSIMARMNVLEQSQETELSLWGNGLKTSSNGEVGLDMFSILSSGFGIIGGFMILFCISWFYRIINYKNKKIMILPFVLGAMGSGSLLILQYSLMVYCLIYLNYKYPLTIADKKQDMLISDLLNLKKD